MPSNYSWNLSDEMQYLNYLGTGKWSRVTKMNRINLLKSYLRTIHYRTEDWVPEAYAYAEKLLQEEQTQ